MVVSVHLLCIQDARSGQEANPSEDHYPRIACTNKYGLQIEKLLNDAGRENSMPFYAFYTAEIADVMCQIRRNDEGVFMAGGHGIHAEVIAVPRRPIASPDLLKHTVALSCFLCCPLVSGREGMNSSVPSDGGDGWDRFIRQYYGSELKHPASNGEDREDAIPGVHQQIPQYIQSFIKAGKEGVPDWWEREFYHNIENVRALVVYDGREKSTTA